MSAAAFNGGLAMLSRARSNGAAVAPALSLPSQVNALEQKLETLQKDYADLNTSIFEAAKVHRRLCAPSLIHYGPFDIASEIFAVRHLLGDLFIVDENVCGVVVEFGDLCHKESGD